MAAMKKIWSKEGYGAPPNGPKKAWETCALSLAYVYGDDKAIGNEKTMVWGPNHRKTKKSKKSTKIP